MIRFNILIPFTLIAILATLLFLTYAFGINGLIVFVGFVTLLSL